MFFSFLTYERPVRLPKMAMTVDLIDNNDWLYWITMTQMILPASHRTAI